MRKLIQAMLGAALVLALSPGTFKVSAAGAVHAPEYSSAEELVQAVNELRAQHGLAPYRQDPLLMGIAQAQAEYLLSIGTITHTGPGGSRPYERALAAGYLVAGDLSQGGFFSENVTAGVGQTAADAVDNWMGDAPHQNTMLSTTLADIGAGVGMSGNTFYYVIDCGLSTGGAPVAYTPRPGQATALPAIIPNTPNPDGKIVHIVQKGDTLGSISVAYHVPLADLLRLNNLTLKSFIYEGNKIIVRGAYTATPTQPTGTPTIRPTATEWLTDTATEIPAAVIPEASTPVPSERPVGATARGTALLIVSVAVLLAGGVTFLGARKRK
jgi:uncharacterized protein YkwD/LysM repeat protein